MTILNLPASPQGDEQSFHSFLTPIPEVDLRAELGRKCRGLHFTVFMQFAGLQAATRTRQTSLA